MPGFKINGEGDGPDSKTETLRAHRFSMSIFMGQPGHNPPLNLLKDVDLPERIIEELQIKTPGSTYKFGKSANYSDLKLVFYTPKDLLSELETYLDLVHTADQGIGDFDDYVNDVIIDLNDSKGSKLVTYSFKNCWVSNIAKSQLSYGSSEILSVTATVKFSWYEVK